MPLVMTGRRIPSLSLELNLHNPPQGNLLLTRTHIPSATHSVFVDGTAVCGLGGALHFLHVGGGSGVGWGCEAVDGPLVSLQLSYVIVLSVGRPWCKCLKIPGSRRLHCVRALLSVRERNALAGKHAPKLLTLKEKHFLLFLQL